MPIQNSGSGARIGTGLFQAASAKADHQPSGHETNSFHYRGLLGAIICSFLQIKTSRGDAWIGYFIRLARLSLTPGFSPVQERPRYLNCFNSFRSWPGKPLKRLEPARGPKTPG